MQTSLHNHRLWAVRFLSLFGLPRGRGLFCFLVGLLLSPSLLAQTITTVAGTGTQGFSGDGGPATSAQLKGPAGMAFDGADNLYIDDTHDHRIRKVIPCTDADLPTVTLVFNNSATVMGTGIPTITVPATPGQQFQVLGGNSFERIIVIDRVNGYEIRQTDRNTTGVFAINRLGLFSLTVTNSNGCSRTVQGILVNP